jgi:hypothetical protein
MYVRFNIDKNGRINLQQLLTLDKLDGKNAQPAWENVPITGMGTTEALSLPIGISCGVFMIDELIQKSGKSINKVNVVSALNISSIAETEDGYTRINTHDKKEYFIVKIPQLDFLKLMTTMLSKFMIISINSDGHITNI